MNYRVYWQPGCTGCLRTKEFLTGHGIPYESINVREQPGAMAELEALGVCSVPVVARGTDYVFAQELREVARFVEVSLDYEPLSAEELWHKLDRILAAAQRYLRQLPPARLDNKLPGRNRTYLDLAYHLFVIPTAFLDAVRGGELTAQGLERTCWHTAQHCRQLLALLEHLDIAPDGAFGAAELDGLPLPERTWDSEVPLGG